MCATWNALLTMLFVMHDGHGLVQFAGSRERNDGR
jgi:hypothetical protein